MTKCARCRSEFNPTRPEQKYCCPVCRNRANAAKQIIAKRQSESEPGYKPPPHDPGAELVAAGKLPTADGLTFEGKLCWTWQSMCRIFNADSGELASMLKPKPEEIRHRESGLYRIAK